MKMAIYERTRKKGGVKPCLDCKKRTHIVEGVPKLLSPDRVSGLSHYCKSRVGLRMFLATQV